MVASPYSSQHDSSPASAAASHSLPPPVSIPADGRSPHHATNYVLENRFYVEIENQITASFTSCQGLSAKITTTTIREGGVNDQQRVLLGPTSFSTLTLSRGMTDSLLFWNWMQATFNGGRGLRRNVNILTFNQAGEVMLGWMLIGAIPVEWNAPELNADGDEIAIESITIAFEGLRGLSRSGGGGADEQVERDRLGYFGS